MSMNRYDLPGVKLRKQGNQISTFKKRIKLQYHKHKTLYALLCHLNINNNKQLT